jgi:hypothetical protein
MASSNARCPAGIFRCIEACTEAFIEACAEAFIEACTEARIEAFIGAPPANRR